MKRILAVFGTRPEAIKMAPVIKELQKYPNHFETFVCVTAQHRQMLDRVLEVFNIEPNFDLNVMRSGQDLTDLTTRVITGMRDVIQKLKPDLVLVHGDTTTSMASGLAAYYQKVMIGHVEAGLRTYNLNSPWPEEMNRQVTDRISNLHFAPTESSKKNLLNEHICSDTIVVTGNTVIDALSLAIDMISSSQEIRNRVIAEIRESGYSISMREYILVTGHRRENFGKGLDGICKALKDIAFEYPERDIVYPVHPNPNVQETVHRLLTDIPNVYLINPLDYLPFVYLMQNARLILTDSGGIQEEAPFLGKPVLVMRNTTERKEAIMAGTVKLVGTNSAEILSSVNEILLESKVYQKMSQAHNPYGDGNASKKIVEAIW